MDVRRAWVLNDVCVPAVWHAVLRHQAGKVDTVVALFAGPDDANDFLHQDGRSKGFDGLTFSVCGAAAGRAAAGRAIMNAERRAIVWCWLAIMFGHEADDIDYAWPPKNTEDDHRRAAALQDRSDACYEHAKKIDPRDDLWERAHAAWEQVP